MRPAGRVVSGRERTSRLLLLALLPALLLASGAIPAATLPAVPSPPWERSGPAVSERMGIQGPVGPTLERAGPDRTPSLPEDTLGHGISYGVRTGAFLAPAPTVEAINLSQPSADVGQAIGFTAWTAGGSGGGSFAWTTDAGLGCAPSTSAVIDCQPSTPNPAFNVAVVWTDSLGTSSTSKSITYPVYTDVTESSPVPSPTSGGADFGQLVVFSAPPSGGVGPYTYAWTGEPEGCAEQGWNLSCVPEGGTANTTYLVQVEATDGDAYTSSPASVSYTVISDPVALPVTASTGSGSIDGGQSVAFSEATPTSGAAGYSFVWQGLPSGCGTLDQRILECTPSVSLLNTTYQVSVDVTDANGYTSVGAPIRFTVDSLPTPAVPASISSSADVGETVVFSTSATGGNGTSYTFAWSVPSGMGCASSSSRLVSCTPMTAGTYAIEVTVDDANGGTGSATLSSFTVNAPPTVGVPVAANENGTDAGQLAVFVAVAEGGSGFWASYHWYGLPATGCTQAYATASCRLPAPEVLQVSVSVTDTDGVTSAISPILVYQIVPDLTIVTFTSDPVRADVGQSVTFTAVTTGGSGGLNFTWTGLPSGCSPSNPAIGPSQLTCTVAAVGLYAVILQVNDSSGYWAPAVEWNLSVDPLPEVEAGTPSRAVADADEEIFFPAVVVAPGAGQVTLLWSGGAQFECSAPVNSTEWVDACWSTMADPSLQVSVTVIDRNGGSSTAFYPFNLTILAGISLTVQASSTVPGLGAATHFTATGSGGRAPYTFVWRFDDGTSSEFYAPTHEFNATGTYLVTLWVNDSLGGSAMYVLVVTVLPAPALFGVPLEFLAAGGVGATLLLVVVAGMLTRSSRSKREELVRTYASSARASSPAPPSSGKSATGAPGGGSKPPPGDRKA